MMNIFADVSTSPRIRTAISFFGTCSRRRRTERARGIGPPAMWWFSGSDENAGVLSPTGEGPPSAVERADTHDKPASTDNTIAAIDTIGIIAEELPSSVSDAHSSTANRRQGLFFFCVMSDDSGVHRRHGGGQLWCPR